MIIPDDFMGFFVSFVVCSMYSIFSKGKVTWVIQDIRADDLRDTGGGRKSRGLGSLKPLDERN